MGRGTRSAIAVGAALAAWALGPDPARALWQSTPIARLSFEGRYDDDLVADGGGAAGIVAPSLGWRLRKPTADLEAMYGLDVYTYARLVPAGGGENHRLRASQTLDLDPRTRLAFRQTGEWLYDPTALARPGVVRTGGEVLFLEGDAELSRRLSPRLRAGLGLRAEGSWFTAPGATDGATLAPRALAGWALGRRDEVTAGYRLQAFSFADAAPWTSHEPSVGYARRLTSTARLALEGGAAIVAGPEGRSFVEPRGRGELSWRWPRVTLAVGAERTLVGAAGLAAPLWSSFASVHGTYRISEPLTLAAGAALFENERPEGGFFASGVTGEARAEYALGEGFAARIAVRRVTQRGEGDLGVELSRNIYAAGLSWRFDGPPPR